MLNRGLLCGLLCALACGRPPANRAHLSTANDAAPPTTTKGAQSLEDAFGIDRVDASCLAFSAHFTNPDRTRILTIEVDGRKHRLQAGVHRVDLAAPSLDTKVVLDELDGPLNGHAHCTDNLREQPEVVERWTATGGTLVFTLSDAASWTRPFEVDLELIDVTFTSQSGETRKVNARFDDLRAGWAPG